MNRNQFAQWILLTAMLQVNELEESNHFGCHFVGRTCSRASLFRHGKLRIKNPFQLFKALFGRPSVALILVSESFPIPFPSEKQFTNLDYGVGDALLKANPQRFSLQPTQLPNGSRAEARRIHRTNDLDQSSLWNSATPRKAVALVGKSITVWRSLRRVGLVLALVTKLPLVHSPSSRLGKSRSVDSSIRLIPRVAGGDHRVVHVERGGVLLLQPDFGEVAAVFLAAVLDGLQEHVLALDE